MKKYHNSQKSVGDRIKQVRNAKGFNQKEFASFVGLNNIVSLSRYENNTTKQNITVLINISQKCNISLDWLMTGEGNMYKTDGIREKVAKYGDDKKIPGMVPVRPVPILNTVPAGFPETPIDDHIIDWVLIPIELTDPKAFALIITGNSMQPKFDSGEVVIISPKANISSGQIGAFRLNGDVTIKRLLEKDGKIYLIAENPDYPPTTLKKGDELVAIGRAVYQIKKVE